MTDQDSKVDTRSDSRLGAIAALLAFLACNGLLVLSAILAGLGIGLDINPHLQAALIALFAILTVFFMLRGYRIHRKSGPPVLASLGAVVIVATLYLAYSKSLESIGLAALAIAALWNWRLRRQPGPSAKRFE
jgi:hypothetical protein